jgi:lambda family phage portal protein
MAPQANWIDRLALAIAPKWGLSRVRTRAAAQVLARHYEGASSGRRTQNWSRKGTDANAALTQQIAPLRNTARDLVRNNSWARNGLETLATSIIGGGIRPKGIFPPEAAPAVREKLSDLWRRWAETTDCDADGRLTFYGIQDLIARQIVEGGEVLIRRRWRKPEDGLAVPMQLQVLEGDFLDHTRDHAMLLPGMQPGAKVLQGVEFDLIGRRTAYWLFDQHPGSTWFITPVSKRYPTTDILHVYKIERPGQVRGVTWFAPGIVNLKDFDEYEDANLVAAKIQACFAGFVTDYEGTGTPNLGQADATNPTPMVETFSPGMIVGLPPGKDVKIATPPTRPDDGFSTRQLRKFAAGLGVTYEQLTGDYSMVNFSSARMGQLRHLARVEGSRWNMIIPQFCDPVWAWFMDAARLGGVELPATAALPTARWTPPPAPMIDPNTEVIANKRRVRALQATPSEIIREQGYDPDEFLAEYAADMKKIHALGIISDSDPSETTDTGQAQAAPADATATAPGGVAKPKNGAQPKNGTASPAA